MSGLCSGSSSGGGVPGGGVPGGGAPGGGGPGRGTSSSFPSLGGGLGGGSPGPPGGGPPGPPGGGPPGPSGGGLGKSSSELESGLVPSERYGTKREEPGDGKLPSPFYL